MVVHPDSTLDVGLQARHLSELQKGIPVVAPRIDFTALDLPLVSQCILLRRYVFPLRHDTTWNLSLQLHTSPLNQMTRTPLDVEISPTTHRFAVSRHMDLCRMSVACSTTHGNKNDWTEMGLPTRLKRSKRRPTEVILLNRPSSALIENFECESATSKCSDNHETHANSRSH